MARVKHLSFGPAFPGLVNPLDNLDRILHDELQTFKYYLKVCPISDSHIGHVHDPSSFC